MKVVTRICEVSFLLYVYWREQCFIGGALFVGRLVFVLVFLCYFPQCHVVSLYLFSGAYLGGIFATVLEFVFSYGVLSDTK